jgi:hypothetical protein
VGEFTAIIAQMEKWGTVGESWVRVAMVEWWGTVSEFTAIIARMEKWKVLDLARVSEFSGGVRIAPVAVRAMGV